MRYRKLSTDGDYVFGQSQADFLIDSPEAVAQAVKTRLLLLRGEWFLDSDEGTPYSTQILGKASRAEYEQAFRERILDTQGVEQIIEFSTSVDDDRNLSVSATILTIFGTTKVSFSL